MCTSQTLAYSNEGYIVRCSGCGRFQLAFGVAAVTLSSQQFNRFRRRAVREWEYHCYATEPQLKCVSLPVNSTLMLCLTAGELGALTDLLDQAAGLLEVYEMLAVH